VSAGAQPVLGRYLDEIDRGLGAGPADRRDVLDEVRDHLLEVAGARQAAGLDEHAAALAAVEEFGCPRRVAAGFRRALALRESGRLVRDTWRMFLVFAVPGTTAWFLLPAMLVHDLDPRGMPLVGGAQASGLLMALGLVAISLLRVRRPWLRERRLPALLGLSAVLAWFVALDTGICAAFFAVRVALAEQYPSALPWAVAAGMAGGAVALRMVRPHTSTRLLLATLRAASTR
jgi:hypothetical protein